MCSSDLVLFLINSVTYVKDDYVVISGSTGDTELQPTCARSAYSSETGGVNGSVNQSESVSACTRREQEVASLLAQGFDTKEIAARLHLVLCL